MPTPTQFYANSHRGLAFGVVDSKHPNGHSGSDFNGWPEGTRIPAVWPGRVARRGSTSNFGNWISVYIGGPDRLYLHYCHLDDLSTAPPVGAMLAVGSDSGPLGNTGYSFGNHLHLMCSTSDNPEAYAGVRDPMPFVNATLAAAAGGGGGGGGIPSQKGTIVIYSPLVVGTPPAITNPRTYALISEAGGLEVVTHGDTLHGQLARQGILPAGDDKTLYLSSAQKIAAAFARDGVAADVDVDEAALAAQIAATLVAPSSPLLAAIDLLDDDDRAADRAAITAAISAIKPGATAAEFVAALKAAL